MPGTDTAEKMQSLLIAYGNSNGFCLWNRDGFSWRERGWDLEKKHPLWHQGIHYLIASTQKLWGSACFQQAWF